MGGLVPHRALGSVGLSPHCAAAALRNDCARRKAVTSCKALASAASALWLAVATMSERMATARSRAPRLGWPAACGSSRRVAKGGSRVRQGGMLPREGGWNARLKVG